MYSVRDLTLKLLPPKTLQAQAGSRGMM